MGAEIVSRREQTVSWRARDNLARNERRGMYKARASAAAETYGLLYSFVAIDRSHRMSQGARLASEICARAHSV